MFHVPEPHSWMQQITVTQSNRFILHDRDSTFKCLLDSLHSCKSVSPKLLKSHQRTHEPTLGCCCDLWRCRSTTNEPIRAQSANCHLLFLINMVLTMNQSHGARVYTGTKTVAQLNSLSCAWTRPRISVALMLLQQQNYSFGVAIKAPFVPSYRPSHHNSRVHLKVCRRSWRSLELCCAWMEQQRSRHWSASESMFSRSCGRIYAKKHQKCLILFAAAAGA